MSNSDQTAAKPVTESQVPDTAQALETGDARVAPGRVSSGPNHQGTTNYGAEQSRQGNSGIMVIKTKRKPTGAAALGAGPGRPKGTGNKATAQLKEMILEALDNAGGVTYLKKRAVDPKTSAAFLALIGKVLPMTVAGDPNSPVSFNLVLPWLSQAIQQRNSA